MDGVTDRVTVREAAARLSVTTDAIRQRIKRGTIPHDKDPDGLSYVYISPSEDVTDAATKAEATESTDALLSVYKDQVEFLRRELERKDHLLAAALERIPAIEPPEKPRTPERAAEKPEGSEAPDRAEGPETAASRPSWWRRFFGVE